MAFALDAAQTALWWKFVNDRENVELRNQLLTPYLPLVRYAISRYLKQNDLPFDAADEYVGLGWMGLIQAAEKYHPGKPCQFSTYVVNAVSWAIQRENRKSDPGLERRGLLAKQRRMASHALGRRANDSDLAGQIGTSEERLSMLIVRAANSRQVSAGEFSGVNSPGRSPDPSDAIVVRDTLEAALGILRPREREFLEQIYGNDRPQREIAEESGISRQRVAMISTQAIERIQARVNTMGTAHEFTQERFHETVAAREPSFAQRVEQIRKARETAPVRTQLGNTTSEGGELDALIQRQLSLEAWIEANPHETVRVANVKNTLAWLQRQIAQLRRRKYPKTRLVLQ